MYYVYILQSKKNKSIYKGSTSNLRDRLLEHNSGRVRSTKNAKPWRIVYYEAFSSKVDTRREELFLKSGKGRERIKYLLTDTLS